MQWDPGAKIFALTQLLIFYFIFLWNLLGFNNLSYLLTAGAVWLGVVTCSGDLG